MNKVQPYIQYLLSEVEKYHVRPIKTTVNFEALSTIIEHQTGERLSASTLKRLWGYVSDKRDPRQYTLDVLSIYIGYKNFENFCNRVNELQPSGSSFFETFSIASSDLTKGDKLEIAWSPNRYLVLEYLGANRYVITQAQNSKLMIGDEFMVISFMLGYPLHIPNVIRNNEILPSFVAGTNGGLTILSNL